ncbi:MaoC family dehydratase [Flavobacterium sp. N1994]|uniref:MaoC family dehydratase n=1 Tax=Flavobacterium sp. N1994 TaxID=2986827 RepID=UPI002222A13B|nr:MaoC family dehydratase [Flavobacterium sp. N1994]
MKRQINVGDKANSFFTYTTALVEQFSSISKDVNPIHLDKEFAAKTLFEKPIVHGIFVSGQISALIANELPGPGSIYLYQDLNFLAPVYHDDTINCIVEVVEKKEEKNILILKTICQNQNGKNVIEGKAVIKLV